MDPDPGLPMIDVLLGARPRPIPLEAANSNDSHLSSLPRYSSGSRSAKPPSPLVLFFRSSIHASRSQTSYRNSRGSPRPRSIGLTGQIRRNTTFDSLQYFAA